MSVQAYVKARAYAETPRMSELRLIAEVTHELVAAAAQRLRGPALMAPLHRNREMWALFATMCADDANQLPPELRARIISLGLWVDRHTSAVMRGEEDIDSLIDVNRTIMEGLTDRPGGTDQPG
ncbi:flagellar biosynthesis regulator FlaF [Sphingomonas sp. RHCKR7]|uniref:flagellar biosynthesis regulator FlaF n=1 Tax=Sphingomonas folli TaxID=2862497 RepID=UPI001CA4D254|nr:flagellar biosynthesis regulator FlaF [Sphingomonas folli]MBW6525556.1 flagellar biosynthesis regulator FlaF [Sphingomonas folli]